MQDIGFKVPFSSGSGSVWSPFKPKGCLFLFLSYYMQVTGYSMFGTQTCMR